MKSFKSNGKLLISGEYAVLDGALSLALPTKFGQSLEVENIEESKIIWKSLDHKGDIWFEDVFSIINKRVSLSTTNNSISNRLIEILNTTKTLNSNFLNTRTGFKITTKLEFPKNWGLGTSSTLINNIAQWVNIDPYTLLNNTFGGSGYDIACAQNNVPITYQLQNSKPIVNTINFNPKFKNHLYFIYLNKKQNSRDGIKHYNANKGSLKSVITEINNLTLKIVDCDNLNNFESLINQHESIISKLTKQTTVKNAFFKDFKGSIKSLGAWGGDFILATSKEENPSTYFKAKGFNTIIPYGDMII